MKDLFVNKLIILCKYSRLLFGCFHQQECPQQANTQNMSYFLGSNLQPQDYRTAGLTTELHRGEEYGDKTVPERFELVQQDPDVHSKIHERTN